MVEVINNILKDIVCLNFIARIVACKVVMVSFTLSMYNGLNDKIDQIYFW